MRLEYPFNAFTPRFDHQGEMDRQFILEWGRALTPLGAIRRVRRKAAGLSPFATCRCGGVVGGSKGTRFGRKYQAARQGQTIRWDRVAGLPGEPQRLLRLAVFRARLR